MVNFPKVAPNDGGENLSQSISFPYERRARIAALVIERGAVSVQELSSLCGVSTLTIRRDLDALATAQQVRRTRGGAIALGETGGNGTQAASSARGAITERVDALILTPTSPKASRTIQRRAAQAGVPVIAEAHPIDGALTLVTLDNFRAGLELGRWAGAYLRKRPGRPVRGVTISASLENVEARRKGFVQGLVEEYPEVQIALNVFGEGEREQAREIMEDVLSVHPDLNLIFAGNDAMLHGALDAYRNAGLDEAELLALTIGLEGRWGKQLLMSNGPCKAGVAMFPEVVGRACVDAAVCAVNGWPLPPYLTTPAVVATPETLARYYAPVGDDWQIQWEAVEALWTRSEGAQLRQLGPKDRRPKRIGFVYNFASHEWYQNVLRAMRARAVELGIELDAVDASENLFREMEELKIGVAQTAAQCIAEGETILLDSGSTIGYLSEALLSRRQLTVITNSIPALATLSKNAGLTLVSTGGVLQPRTGALVGSAALATLANLRVDKAFISASGVDLATGLYAKNPEEAAVKQAMIRAAREVYLVVDHTKIGEAFVTWFAPLSVVSTLITDDALPAAERVQINQLGIKVRM